MSEGFVVRARAALAHGDVLIAYDEATRATEADPSDLTARYLAALALARAGARDGAERAAHELSTLIERRGGQVDLGLQEDAAALVARIAKDEALETPGEARAARLRAAAERYEDIALRFGRHYTCVNAATLFLLAGDVEHARSLAERAQRLARDDVDPTAVASYWRAATLAEAALVLGDVDAAGVALEQAARLADRDDAARAATRRQLRLVCDAAGIDGRVLDVLAAPLVVHYCGHRNDPSGQTARFPVSVERAVERDVAAFVASRHVGFGYGSLASGADIIVAEALVERGAQLHVVLPCAAEEFDRVSVAPAGEHWSERFRRCLERAASVVFASDSSFVPGDDLFGYASRIAMGHALNRGAFLDAPVEQLAVWNEAETGGAAGTAHDVEVWRRTGHRTQVIALPAPERPGEVSPSAPDSGREIAAILFADFHGFSRLRDEHFPIFVTKVFAALGAVFDRHAEHVWWRNTWGDGIAAVIGDVTAGAECAVELQEALAQVDLAAIGLPSDLGLRIGAHAGPVIQWADPISGRTTFWRREVTRAARIEPRTPEGEVYVTDAFAALLALEPNAPFATDYVGRITTAKDFETIPMYRLRRRAARSASAAR